MDLVCLHFFFTSFHPLWIVQRPHRTAPHRRHGKEQRVMRHQNNCHFGHSVTKWHRVRHKNARDTYSPDSPMCEEWIIDTQVDKQQSAIGTSQMHHAHYISDEIWLFVSLKWNECSECMHGTSLHSIACWNCIIHFKWRACTSNTLTNCTHIQHR